MLTILEDTKQKNTSKRKFFNYLLDTQKVVLEPLNNDKYRLLNKVSFYHLYDKYSLKHIQQYPNTNASYIFIAIPELFEFDGISVPKIFTSIFDSPFYPKYIKAALVHDFLYTKSGAKLINNNKKIADGIFLDILMKFNRNKLTIMLFGMCLKLFGKKYWLKRD